LTKIGLVPRGGNYKTVKMKIKKIGLDISHFTGQGHLKGKTHNWAKKIPLEDILIKNSTYTSTTKLKDRLFKEKYLEKKCYECELTEWRGKDIPLELEHKNGDNTDNRLLNLTVLCPNCHAQTKTYRGKNIQTKAKEYKCKSCEKSIGKGNKSGFCHECYWKDKNKHKKDIKLIKKTRPRKFEISKGELKMLIEEKSFCEIGRVFGVSDNAIRKRAKIFKLI